MNNVTTPETAQRLKDAGFPQPEPKEGQIWYDLIDGQEQPLFIIFDGDFFVDKYGNCYGKKDFEKYGTFAPTATDILRELPKLSSINYMGDHWSVYITGTRISYKHTNPAEAAALAWLDKHEKENG